MDRPDSTLEADPMRADRQDRLRRGLGAGALVRAILAIAASAVTSAALAKDAPAQGAQVVEDRDVGVRFTIPKDWEWRSRDRDVFVDCAPKVESRPGMPSCFFTVAKRKLAQGQRDFTDTDRAYWKSKTTADGMRPFVSTRDLRVAGYPAHEVVVREGKEPDAATSLRVLVLIPGHALIDTWLVTSVKNVGQTARHQQAFRAALDSLQPAK